MTLLNNIFWWQLADIFFFVFHLVLVVFNLLGWVFKSLRRLHLVVISLTLASWFILGIWYGWGYCPLTDWHWDILRELGEYQLPHSYISYLVLRLTGYLPPAELVEYLTVGLALLAFIMSVKVNYFSSRIR